MIPQLWVSFRAEEKKLYTSEGDEVVRGGGAYKKQTKERFKQRRKKREERERGGKSSQGNPSDTAHCRQQILCTPLHFVLKPPKLNHRDSARIHTALYQLSKAVRWYFLFNLPR